MATGAALTFDLQRGPPSARDLSALHEGRQSTAHWWPAAQVGAGLEELKGMTALMATWRPAFETGRCPGEDVVNLLLRRWSANSYEHGLLVLALREAEGLDHEQLVRHETKNVALEAAAVGDDGAREFYALLQACLADLKRAGSRDANAFVVHPKSRELAQWTIHELLRFLHAHWALRKVHLRIKEMTEHRLAALARLDGILEGSADMAATHDEID